MNRLMSASQGLLDSSVYINESCSVKSISLPTYKDINECNHTLVKLIYL